MSLKIKKERNLAFKFLRLTSRTVFTINATTIAVGQHEQTELSLKAAASWREIMKPLLFSGGAAVSCVTAVHGR